MNDLIQKAKLLLGEGKVLSSDKAHAYITDRSKETSSIGNCLVCVVCVENTTDIEICIALSQEFKIPIVPRGLGTGTTGGAKIMEPAICISFERMNAILEIDTQNQVVIVEPGVITADIHKAVEALGLFYPPDPASLAICSIGGNVAENAGGPRCLKYGVTGDYVLGLSGYFADGTPFELGGKIKKNVAGYDLISLLVGSEGTLAIISKIILRLIAKPCYQDAKLYGFDTDSEGLHCLSKIISRGIQPSAVEFFSNECRLAVEQYTKQPLSSEYFAAYLLVEIDGDSEQSCLERREILDQLTPNTLSVASDDAWELRRAISPALTAAFDNKISHDVVLPSSEISEFLTQVKIMGLKYDITVIGYGHLGDGNIHLNFLNSGLSTPTFLKSQSLLCQEALCLVISLGGSLSGEHGIGLSKQPYMPLMFSKKELSIMKKIKSVFDPKNRFNPKKIF